MDVHAKQRELFFNNLLILEFDKSAVENEYRVKCDKDMFSLPNQKMFEVVTHFLFEKLNEVSEKEYNLPWPLMDKEQRRQFQKTSVNYLSSIAQESNVKFPRVVLSVISTFGGDRFYELYLSFSSHVVEKNIRRNDNVSLILRPSISKHNSQDAVETLRIATMLSGEKLQEIQDFSLKSFELYLRTSNNFIAHIQKLKSSLATNSSLLKEKNKFLESSFFCESVVNGKSLQYSIEKIFENAKKTRKYWKQLQIFLDKEKQFWEYLFPIIKENPEMFLLDGAQLKLDIGDFIKEQCSELNEMGSVETKEEKVSLLKYLNIYYIFLKLYEKTFLKGDLLQIKELSNVQKIWSFESNINELKTLHEKLLATVLNIKENNKMLEDRLFLEEISEDLQIFTKECSSWNFSSKSFQDEINTSRLIYTDNITDDVLKTSLFTNDSGLESGNWKIEDTTLSSSDSSSARHSNFEGESVSLASVIEPAKPSQTFAIDEFSSFNQIMQTNILSTRGKKKLKSEITLGPDLVQTSTINTEKAVPKQSSLNATGLVFDIDLDYHKTRNIRESWLLEESLDSVTLPETSFLD
ncbi:HAUS augmin-like complex subunit 6 [Argiope bruennichi]|uniref:HAUS augmin-like complex subunit 6 n=1 Tax=Argiope bruennichi TaxID=94029 RepID=UPI00249477E1|nr:HAUS augmin-like complex subunit 6 [Argiope bruennichi]